MGNNIKVLLHRPVPLAKHELGLFVGWTGGLHVLYAEDNVMLSHLTSSILSPHKVNFLFLVGCYLIISSHVMHIQHAATVFRQPALNGFTIQASTLPV